MNIKEVLYQWQQYWLKLTKTKQQYKMRSTQSNPTKKSDTLRKQIRRKQITQLFSTHRHQLPILSIDQSTQIVRQNFKQLQSILSDRINSLYNNHRLQIVMKQLRDISCQHQVPQLFHVINNLNILVELANCRELDRITQVFLYQILLNVSSMRDQSILLWDATHRYTQHGHLPLQMIKIQNVITDCKGQLVELGLKIIGNMVEKDKTSKTMYFLLTKVRILKIMIKILIDHKQIYLINKMQQIFLWFANKIISTIVQFKFQSIDSDYRNFVALVGMEILRVFQLRYLQDRQQESQGKSAINVQMNDILIYIKTGIKVNAFELDQCFIGKIQQYFSPHNLHYIDFLCVLTFRTLYIIPLNHLEALLEQLLSYPDTYAPNILRCITNSLINDGTQWKTVLKYFIHYSQNRPLEQTKLQGGFERMDQDEPSGFLTYFLYFLNRSNTERDMAEIIGMIICGQGGLGIFQSGLQQLADSACMVNKLESYGVDIEIQK